MIHVVDSQPLISTSSAHCISLALGIIYVGSLYLSKNARISLKSVSSRHTANGRDRVHLRDDPEVVWARLAAVSVATLVCCALVFAVVWRLNEGRISSFGSLTDDFLTRLGAPVLLFSPLPFTFSIYPHLVAPVLFLGPLYATFLNHELPGQRNWRWQSHISSRFYTVHGLRNYLMGPITEEIVFRACILAVYHMSGASKWRMIFLSPLVFGLAHVHHAYDTYLSKGQTQEAFKVAIAGSLFHMAYTTLFGFYVSFLFLRTGSILPPISAHIFCNVMGLPQIDYEMRRHPKRANVIKGMYCIGIIGFIVTLRTWTRIDDSIYWPSVSRPDLRYHN